MSWFSDLIKDRYTTVSSGVGPTQPRLDLGNIAKDVGVAGALYGIINPNDSSGLASFFGTGGRQQPIGYTGGIPNYTATRELAPNAFAQTYTTPTGEMAPRRPGAAGRRYFTDTAFTQSTDTPFMGITAEQIAAQNQAAQEERDLFESLLGSAATQRETVAAEQAAEQARQAAAAEQARQAAAAAKPRQEGEKEPTARQRYATMLDEGVDPSNGLDRAEQELIAKSITDGAFNIDEIAQLYDAQSVDVVEGLLRGGFQTPEQVVGLYNKAGVEDFDEPKLIAALLDQGKTTPEEVAAYYKDHPVYGGITPEQVKAAFKDLGGTREFARGGNVNGYYLGGPTDGMADQIPATINNMQPAALSDGEFVIPADVVSHLGNGNSDAGAQNLYSMMERVRRDRTGNPKQGKQIDPNKYLA